MSGLFIGRLRGTSEVQMRGRNRGGGKGRKKKRRKEGKKDYTCTCMFTQHLREKR